MYLSDIIKYTHRINGEIKSQVALLKWTHGIHLMQMIKSF